MIISPKSLGWHVYTDPDLKYRADLVDIDMNVGETRTFYFGYELQRNSDGKAVKRVVVPAGNAGVYIHDSYSYHKHECYLYTKAPHYYALSIAAGSKIDRLFMVEVSNLNVSELRISSENKEHYFVSGSTPDTNMHNSGLIIARTIGGTKYSYIESIKTYSFAFTYPFSFYISFCYDNSMLNKKGDLQIAKGNAFEFLYNTEASTLRFKLRNAKGSDVVGYISVVFSQGKNIKLLFSVDGNGKVEVFINDVLIFNRTYTLFEFARYSFKNNGISLDGFVQHFKRTLVDHGANDWSDRSAANILNVLVDSTIKNLGIINNSYYYDRSGTASNVNDMEEIYGLRTGYLDMNFIAMEYTDRFIPFFPVSFKITRNTSEPIYMAPFINLMAPMIYYELEVKWDYRDDIKAWMFKEIPIKKMEFF